MTLARTTALLDRCERQIGADDHHHATKVDSILLCPGVAAGTSPGAVCRAEDLALVYLCNPLPQGRSGQVPWAVSSTLVHLSVRGKYLGTLVNLGVQGRLITRQDCTFKGSWPFAFEPRYPPCYLCPRSPVALGCCGGTYALCSGLPFSMARENIRGGTLSMTEVTPKKSTLLLFLVVEDLGPGGRARCCCFSLRGSTERYRIIYVNI